VTEVVQQDITDDSSSEASENGRVVGPSEWDVVLSSIADEVGRAQADWSRFVTDRVSSPLRQVVSDATSESKDALSRFVEAQGQISNEVECWDAIAAYRQAIEEKAITPIAKHLRDDKPGHTVSTLFQDLLATLADQIESLPPEMEIEEAGQALKRRPGDGFRFRVRKAISRSLSSLGKRQPVPVKVLGQYHLLVRLPRFFSRRREETQIELARCETRLETAISKWTYAVLDLEASLDSVAGFIDPERKIATVTQAEPTDSTPNDETTVEEERLDIADVMAQIRAVGLEFSDALDVAAADVTTMCPPVSSDQQDSLHEFLDYDAGASHTFLLKLSDREVPADQYLPANLAREKDAAWIRYQEESRNRMRLDQHLLRSRSTLVILLDRMTSVVFSGTVEPLREAQERLAASILEEKTKLEGLFDQVGDGVELTNLAVQLRTLNEKALSGVKQLGSELGGINAADEALRDLGGREWERSRREVDQLPGDLEIHAIDFESETEPSVHARRSSVNLKKIVNNVLGLRFADQLRKPGEQLRRVMVRQWGAAEAIIGVVAFGSDAACNALETHHGDEVLAEARELAIEGLDRALERTKGTVGALDGPWIEFNDAAVGVVINVWNHIFMRVRSEELDTDQWAGIGSRLSVVVSTYRLSMKRWSGIAFTHLRTWARFIRWKGGALIRKGRTAVGASAEAKHSGTVTINALRDIERINASMPLIYRRLFTFESLNNVSFLENRNSDLSGVKQHFKLWTDGGQSNPLILSAQLGSGRTSFMNSLVESVFSEADVRTVRFSERFRSSDDVATTIADALGLDISGTVDFDRLEEELATLGRQKPIVCQLYDLEHLILAVPHGLAVIKDLFVFLARTDNIIYWIGGISDLARHFLRRTMTTSGLVEFRGLTPFDKKSIEAVIMNRHRRSGLEITFGPPSNPTTLMRQRLNRAKSDDDRQEIIRGAFFERIVRLADQNLRLTLFFWIRSLEFDDSADSVKVQWPAEIDFSVLATLDIQREFSLRSFLLHQSLTPEEHNEIFRMTDTQGTVILESLLNSGLLTGTDKKLDSLDLRIRPGANYRIHPLLLGPVRSHLVGRHIVY
jgi:hypothetical protein